MTADLSEQWCTIWETGHSHPSNRAWNVLPKSCPCRGRCWSSNTLCSGLSPSEPSIQAQTQTQSPKCFWQKGIQRGETFSSKLLGVAYIVKSAVLHIGTFLTQFLVQSGSVFHRRFYLSEEAEIKGLFQRNSQKNNENKTRITPHVNYYYYGTYCCTWHYSHYSAQSWLCHALGKPTTEE